jgi:Protein of unknown function (DUF3570)
MTLSTSNKKQNACNQAPKINTTKKQQNNFTKLTSAALLLPGLLPATVHAADEDSVDFQYSHYQEGRRDIDLSIEAFDPNTGESLGMKKVPNIRNPIEVDSLHGSARVTLTDRITFAFNYLQDTWSGATPLGTAPSDSQANRLNNFKGFYPVRYGNTFLKTGASPYTDAAGVIDRQRNFLKLIVNPNDSSFSYVKDRPVHVMSYASPETRKQGDIKFTYQWNEAAFDFGGGISVENDYDSRFVNLGGRFDFNQKLTTLNWGLSYTNSAIAATLDHVGAVYTDLRPYRNNINPKAGTINGTRQDWAASLGLTQVVNQDAMADFGLTYTRSTGFLENPYKLAWVFMPFTYSDLPDQEFFDAKGEAFIEQRPNERNLFNWSTRWTQYIEPLDAALHLGYSFSHDDWGIHAHTFDADWVQPLGYGWTVTPRIRYYSQSAADFYAPSFLTKSQIVDPLSAPPPKEKIVELLPAHFSSDQRLSGYGTLSGGVTVAKQFAKGIGVEAGFEYYTHQGGLKLGGGGEGDFADFDYWVANAALTVNLAAIGQGLYHDGHSQHNQHSHPTLPAGVLFGHTLDKAGDFMVGYRYLRNWQADGYLNGDKGVSIKQATNNGCTTPAGCNMLPTHMTMSMHMLDLMYAPTDWLTLMLMPQWMDMDMDMRWTSARLNTMGHGHSTATVELGGHDQHNTETGGIGDTGMYAMFKLFDRPSHHLHGTLGFSAPTGDTAITYKIHEDYNSTDMDGGLTHYGMQMGSGTWDFKPSLTYTGKADAWSWGAQAGGTVRMENRNSSGYALGDIFEGSLWGGYDITHWLTGTVRVAYSWQDRIRGSLPRGLKYEPHRKQVSDKLAYGGCSSPAAYIYGDPDPKDWHVLGQPYFHKAEYEACAYTHEIEDRPTSMDNPANYGGHYVDLGLGLSVNIPHGAFAGNRLSFEWLQPVYTNVNGYQLDRDGALAFTWSYGF